MKKNRIYSYSKNRMIVIIFIPLLLLLPITFFSLKLLGQSGLIVSMVFLVLALINSFYAPKYLAKSVLEIRSSTGGFSIFCIKPFYGNKISDEVFIRFDELKSYRFESTHNFSTFKVTLKRGSTYQFHRWYNDNADQFNRFLVYFEKEIKLFNLKKNEIDRIEKEKSFVENRILLLVVAIILILIVTITLVLFILNGIKNTYGFIFVFVFLPPLIWLSIVVFKGLKRKNR